jgi:hypothetical protein
MENATAAPARPGPPGPPGRPAPAPAAVAVGPGSGSASPDAAGEQRIVTVTSWLIFRLNNSIETNFLKRYFATTLGHIFLFFHVKHDTRHIYIYAPSKDCQIHKIIFFLLDY